MPFISRKFFVTASCLTLVALVAGCGSRTWTKADTAREAAYLVLHTVDWGQTLYIADHPGEYRERNRLMFSEHPSRGEVNWKFAAGALIHPLVSYALPDDWRPWWQYGTIGLEIYCVGNNASIGVGMGW